LRGRELGEGEKGDRTSSVGKKIQSLNSDMRLWKKKVGKGRDETIKGRTGRGGKDQGDE